MCRGGELYGFANGRGPGRRRTGGSRCPCDACGGIERERPRSAGQRHDRYAGARERQWQRQEGRFVRRGGRTRRVGFTARGGRAGGRLRDRALPPSGADPGHSDRHRVHRRERWPHATGRLRDHRPGRRRSPPDAFRDHAAAAGPRRSRVRRVPSAQPAVRGTGDDPPPARDHGCRARRPGDVVEPEWQDVGRSADDYDDGWSHRDAGRPLLVLRHPRPDRHHHRWRLISGMARPDLPVSLLLRVVPDLAELAVLRRAILAASSADERRAWAGSASYATYEQRVLSLGEMSAAIRNSYRESVQRTRRIHRTLRRAMAAIALDDGERAIRDVIALAVAAEEQDHWQDAVAFYELALTLCDIVDADPALRVLAKRSAGRARLRAGDLATAETHYRGALEV